MGSAVLVLENDVDSGGGAAVYVCVPAPGHVFHETDVAGAKHVPGPITRANLDFTGQMNDQPAFGQGVEVHLSGPVKLLHPDLTDIGQGAQGRVLLQTQFLQMAFPVAPGKHAIDAHSVPPHSLRLLRAGLRVGRQTLASAPHALAGPQARIVATRRRIVQRYAAVWGARWR